MNKITRLNKKSFDIMKHVSVLDQIRCHVFIDKRGVCDVQFECLDVTKKLVFDYSAKKELENQIIQKASTLKISDPRTKQFIEEFSMRMIEALSKNGLVEICEIEDAPEDPYAQSRKD